MREGEREEEGSGNVNFQVVVVVIDIDIHTILFPFITKTYVRTYVRIVYSPLIWVSAFLDQPADQSFRRCLSLQTPIQNASSSVFPPKSCVHHQFSRGPCTQPYYFHFCTTTPPRLKSLISPKTTDLSVNSLVGKVVCSTYVRCWEAGDARSTNA